MPRFSVQEKNRIQQLLIKEGERLFVTYGIKKVTVDDIVKAVNIAKASFYKFYEGKEYLFLDIVQQKQKEIFDKLNQILVSNCDKEPRERVKEVFFLMSQLMGENIILVNIDLETIEIITRKVSSQRIAEFTSQGFDAVKVIEQRGIKFKVESETVSCLFHTLYNSWISLKDQPDELKRQVINIMLDGILGEIL